MGHRREEKDTSLAVVDGRALEPLRAVTHAIDNLLATWRQPFYGHQRIVHQPPPHGFAARAGRREQNCAWGGGLV